MNAEQAIGSRIRAFREGVGMSQADLAAGLSDLGLPGFYPQTIVKIEQGKRALKFTEGLAMARLLRIEPDLLAVGAASFTEEDVFIRRLVRACEASHARVNEAFDRLRQNEANLAEGMDNLGISKEPDETGGDSFHDWVRVNLRIHSAAVAAETLAQTARLPKQPNLTGDWDL